MSLGEEYNLEVLIKKVICMFSDTHNLLYFLEEGPPFMRLVQCFLHHT